MQRRRTWRDHVTAHIRTLSKREASERVSSYCMSMAAWPSIPTYARATLLIASAFHDLKKYFLDQSIHFHIKKIKINRSTGRTWRDHVTAHIRTLSKREASERVSSCCMSMAAWPSIPTYARATLLIASCTAALIPAGSPSSAPNRSAGVSGDDLKS